MLNGLLINRFEDGSVRFFMEEYFNSVGPIYIENYNNKENVSP